MCLGSKQEHQPSEKCRSHGELCCKEEEKWECTDMVGHGCPFTRTGKCKWNAQWKIHERK